MYKNPYTTGVANKVNEMNRRFIQHADDTGYGFNCGSKMMGLGIHANASKCQCGEMPCGCERGEGYGYGMSGGSGFAQGTFMDNGFGRTIGAGMSSGSKTYRKRGCGGTGSVPPPENLNEYPLIASGKFVVKPVQDHAIQDHAQVERAVGGRKRGKGWNELKSDLGKFDFNRIKDWVGLAKPPSDLKHAVGKLMNLTQREQLPKKAEKVVERNQMQAVIGGGRSTRNEIVKRVMKEKGLKMIEASSYVKKHNLYKK